MSIPIANNVQIIVNSGTIVNDNSNNLIWADIEPVQLTNQIAVLELEHAISISPQSRNELFSTRVPSSPRRRTRRSVRRSRFESPHERKINIMFLFIFLSHMSIFIFLILILNHREPVD